MLIALGVLLVVVVLVAAMATRRQRTEALRKRFGPEYNRTIEAVGDRTKAEAELASRAKRVESLDIHPLSVQQRERFLSAWQQTQAGFVDNPAAAVKGADRLVTELMSARGYPMGDFEQLAADISVDHPTVVQNYRSAHDFALQNERGEASTEELRQAMVYYRDLFNELLETQEPEREMAEVAK